MSEVQANYKPLNTAETLGLDGRKNSGLGLRTPNRGRITETANYKDDQGDPVFRCFTADLSTRNKLGCHDIIFNYDESGNLLT